MRRATGSLVMMKMRLVLSGLVMAGCALMAARDAGAQLLLVANQGDRTVSVIDPGSGRATATVAENVPGQWGHEIAASADGQTAFLPIYGNSGVGRPGIDGDKMLVIDLASDKVAGEIDIGHGVRAHL